MDCYDSNNSKLAFLQQVVYVQRAGGFGGKRSSDKQVLAVDAPKRAPDSSVKQNTAIDQVIHLLMKFVPLPSNYIHRSKYMSVTSKKIKKI